MRKIEEKTGISLHQATELIQDREKLKKLVKTVEDKTHMK